MTHNNSSPSHALVSRTLGTQLARQTTTVSLAASPSVAVVSPSGFSDSDSYGHPAPRVLLPPRNTEKKWVLHRVVQNPSNRDSAPKHGTESGLISGNRDGLQSVCSWVGCAREIKADSSGYCRRHYLKARSAAGPLPDIGLAGDSNGRWLGDAVGIAAAHDRLRRLRGGAHLYSCHGHGKLCPARAEQWALIPGTGTKRDETSGCWYSIDPNDYVPLCVACHLRTDRAYTPPAEQPELPLGDVDSQRVSFDPSYRVRGAK